MNPTGGVNSEGAEARLAALDKQADQVIRDWSLASLLANLAPPPFDMIAVSATFARLGQRMGAVYGQPVSRKTLKAMARSMAKGVTSVAAASYIGTGLLKWVPGVNVGIALLVQPPIVGAVAFSVGQAFKSYYRVILTEGRCLGPEEMGRLAEIAMRGQLSGGILKKAAGIP